jgi:hypothetical protein
MLTVEEVRPGVYVLPVTLGETVRATAQGLKTGDERAAPQALLYAEKRGGFSCRTCRYVHAQNATHGKCAIMAGTVHLDEGCCCAWDADTAQLHLYREPVDI